MGYDLDGRTDIKWTFSLLIKLREKRDALAEIRERFQDAEFTLPIGASTGGSMRYPESLARFCDVVILHGNGRPPGEKLQKVRQHTD